MNRLAALLNELDELVHDRQFPVATNAAPGATDDEIDQTLQPFRLEAPDEVRTWFRWHNGSSEPENSLWRQIVPGWQLISVQEAATMCEFNRAEFPLGDPSAWMWNRSWFPILKEDARLVVADCSPPATKPTPVYVVDYHTDLPANPPVPSFSSITEMADTFVTVTRDARITYDANNGVLVLDDNDRSAAPPGGTSFW